MTLHRSRARTQYRTLDLGCYRVVRNHWLLVFQFKSVIPGYTKRHVGLFSGLVLTLFSRKKAGKFHFVFRKSCWAKSIASLRLKTTNSWGGITITDSKVLLFAGTILMLAFITPYSRWLFRFFSLYNLTLSCKSSNCKSHLMYPCVAEALRLRGRYSHSNRAYVT